MGFASKLYANEPIINDSTPESVTHASEFGRGLDLGLRGPMGYHGTAEDFPQELLIDASEWEARIKESEEKRSRISDQIDFWQLPCKNQKSTNYCWIFGPVGCVEVLRMQQGQKYVSLSPASAGAQVKGFRNVGGWGKEGLEFIVEHGLTPSEQWPDTAIDRRYLTEENKQAALDYRVTEWMALKPRNIAQLVSCLLRRIPVAVGFNWWGHEVYACDAAWIDRAIAIRIRNSWYVGDNKPWGSNGFGILQGTKMYADDQVAPRVAIAI